MPPAKKAQPNRLGPTENKSGSQPPWAMVSADGADMLYPQSAEQAREYLAAGATPVDPALWPWASEIPLTDAPTEEDQEEDQGTTIAAEVAHEVARDEVGMRESESASEPPTDPESLDVLGCPTPALCWPLGLPHDVSYVTCTHGGWAIGD